MKRRLLLLTKVDATLFVDFGTMVFPLVQYRVRPYCPE